MNENRYLLNDSRISRSLSLTLCFVAGCAPATFVRISEPSWSSIELREGIAYEEAWRQTIDVLARKFDLEVISKDGGYIRTSWIHTWWKAGILTENYRVRAMVKFTPDRKQADIKTEANYMRRGTWLLGTDALLLDTVKSDLMGVVGRTTR